MPVEMGENMKQNKRVTSMTSPTSTQEENESVRWFDLLQQSNAYMFAIY